MMLWKPGVLSRFADRFCEEYIELWGIEPADIPPLVESSVRHSPDVLIRQHARIWIRYTDGTCWEIYARDAGLIETLRAGLREGRIAAIQESDFEHRKS